MKSTCQKGILVHHIKCQSLRSVEWEGRGGTSWWEAQHECNACLQPRRPTVSWAASKEAWPAGQRRWFCLSSLLWWDLTWSPASSSGALRPALEPSAQERHGPVGAGPEQGPLLWGKAERVGAVQAGEEKAADGLIAAFQYLKGAYRKDADNLFSKACCDRTRSNVLN